MATIETGGFLGYRRFSATGLQKQAGVTRFIEVLNYIYIYYVLQRLRLRNPPAFAAETLANILKQSD